MSYQESSSSKPYFLVGAHRSGTTLLGLILDSHPDLAWFHHFEWIVKYITSDGTWPSVETYRLLLAEDFQYRVWNLTINPHSKSYPEVLNDFLEQRKQRDRKQFSGATIHTRYFELAKIWPNARFIHIVRDPRDVALSTIKLHWAGNGWGAAKRWKAAELEWNRLCEIVPEDSRMVITFEDLVAEPVVTLKRITHFLGIAYTDQMFSYTEHTPYGYPDASMAFKWRQKMSSQDIEMIEASLGDLLAARGYESVGSRQKASALKKASWYAGDRFIKFNYRVSYYGFGLWAAQFFAKRLGYPPPFKWVAAKVKELDIQQTTSRQDFVADPRS